MKRSCIAVAVFACLLLAGTALATPPDSIAVSIDANSIVQVSIHHPVRSTDTGHYIKTVMVTLNGKTVVVQSFLSQTDLDWQRTSYRIRDAKKGDKLAVTAVCSYFGQLSNTITVSGS